MDRGENFEGSDNESEVGRTYHNPPMLTQEAAGVLAGFGAVYNNNNNILIPSNFQQERDQQTADLNAVMGLDITFENEESGNNEVAIGASSTLGTSTRTSRRVTLSAQKQKQQHQPVINNPYENNNKKRNQPSLPTQALRTSTSAASAQTVLVPPAPLATHQETMNAYARNLKTDPLSGMNNISDQQKKSLTSATHNTTSHEKRVTAAEVRFIDILKEHASNDTVLMEEINTYVWMDDGLTSDRRLYSTLRGNKTAAVKKTILNRALNIWTMKIENLRKPGQPLDANSHEQQVKYLFRAFQDRGIEYAPTDFKGEGEFLGVLREDWKEKKQKDVTFATKRTKPEYDEYGDEKFEKLFTDGTLNPYTNPHNLQICIIWGLGRYLGFRGQDEIVYSKWSQFEITKYKSGPDQGLRKVEAHIKDGYDKSNNLKLGNTAPCEHKPEIREDPNNIHCWVKLFALYREKCPDEQQRFLCKIDDNITRTTWYYPKNAIGKTKIRAMVKEAAETAGFLDWAKFTAHRNRDRMVTATVSNTNVTSKASLAQARHGNAKSQDPYNHNTAVQKHHLQNALLGGIHGNGGLQTNHKSSTNTSLKNENDDDEKENKPIINDNNNKKDTQLTKQLSSPTKDQYRMQLAAATTTHEQDAQRLEKRKHKRDDYKQQRNDYKQQNKKLKSDLTKIEHELSIELQRSKSNDDAHAVEGKQLKSKIGMLELNYSNMKEAMKIERRENNALVEQLEGKESEITSLQQQLQQKATDSKQQATDLKQQAIDSKQQATNIVSLQQQLSNAQQQQMLLMMQQQNHGSCTIM